MNFLEKDLEEIIFNSDYEFLQERGLTLDFGTIKRQLLIGNYGRADLVSHYVDNFYHFINVIELKKENVSMSSFLQAVGYAKGINDYLRKRKIKHFNISITIIGRTIDLESTLCFLPDLFENIKFFTYSYKNDGIWFNEIKNYSLINKGF